VLNSVDAGRRLMLRAALYPLVAIAVAAAGALLLGPKYALAVLLTGLGTVLGGWLAARTALGGGVQAASAAVFRLVLAMVFKVVLIIVALVLGFALWRLPPLGLMAGIVIGLISQMLALAKR